MDGRIIDSFMQKGLEFCHICCPCHVTLAGMIADWPRKVCLDFSATDHIIASCAVDSYGSGVSLSCVHSI
jgi:hypothetical protein